MNNSKHYAIQSLSVVLDDAIELDPFIFYEWEKGCLRESNDYGHSRMITNTRFDDSDTRVE